MPTNHVFYNSASHKTPKVASNYCKTIKALYRYLAYRDLPSLMSKYVGGKVAVDFGSGTGISTQFLAQQGFNVVGLEISEEMLYQAQQNFPNLTFTLLKDGTIPFPQQSVDLVFSSFVLFEIGEPSEMIAYLKEVARVLKKNGIFIAVTGNEELYKRDWFSLQVNYPQNRTLKSGDKAKLSLPEEGLEFIDFFWSLVDYDYFFKMAGLNIIERHFPLAKPDEPYMWRDEINHAPYVIFVANRAFL